jgi:hypothetical protein
MDTVFVSITDTLRLIDTLLSTDTAFVMSPQSFFQNWGPIAAPIIAFAGAIIIVNYKLKKEKRIETEISNRLRFNKLKILQSYLETSIFKIDKLYKEIYDPDKYKKIDLDIHKKLIKILKLDPSDYGKEFLMNYIVDFENYPNLVSAFLAYSAMYQNLVFYISTLSIIECIDNQKEYNKTLKGYIEFFNDFVSISKDLIAALATFIDSRGENDFDHRIIERIHEFY